MNLLGIDIGSSSIKVAVTQASSGRVLASAQSPGTELPIHSPQAGFAEQHPDTWWEHLSICLQQLKAKDSSLLSECGAIGISYQMHGLVVVDKDFKPLRTSIIWCDSRAVNQGNEAAASLSQDYITHNLLNHPGNFTGSKLRWVQQNEPDLYAHIHKAMLPGDYIALRLTGQALTTISGLSEGILWDAKAGAPATKLMEAFGQNPDLWCQHVESYGNQGTVLPQVAQELGLPAGIPVSYRAGDQPNNALSLNVLQPGEAAANAGTSGVLYVVSDKPVADPAGKVNTFVHVNHTSEKPSYGILACVNGTGIAYSWLRKILGTALPAGQSLDYGTLNDLAQQAPAGSEGLLFLPYGNGAERTLQNRNPGASFIGLDFNRHGASHMVRACIEGVAFSLAYSLEQVAAINAPVNTIRAGYANMFLSELFASTFATVAAAPIHLYDSDGARGAAMAAGVGAGLITQQQAVSSLQARKLVEPSASMAEPLQAAYTAWKQQLEKLLA